MDRHFTIPIVIAAAVHGLLFGIPRHTRVVPPNESTVLPPSRPLPEDVITITPVSSSDDPPSSAGRSQTPLPDLVPDRPLPDRVDGIALPIISTDPNRLAARDLTKIEPGDWAPGSGHGNGFDSNGILSVRSLDNPPRARVQVAPVYPMDAKRDGRTGEVSVEFVVDESGNVISPHVVSSSDPVFDEAARRAVARWRFNPGLSHGRVVRFRMVVPIVFRLDE